MEVFRRLLFCCEEDGHSGTGSAIGALAVHKTITAHKKTLQK